MQLETGLLILFIILFTFALSSFITFFVMWLKKRKKPSSLFVEVNQQDDKNTKLLKQYYDNLKKEFVEDFSAYKTNLLINALENISYDNLDYKTFISVRCNNEEIKSKIIGKNGTNKRIIENLVGVDLDIKQMQPIKISSLNPYNREIARQLIEVLIESNYIDENKIKVNYQRTIKKFEDELKKIGMEVIEEILQFSNIDKGLYKYIGKLKYRLSYGQSILAHSIECAKLAKSFAEELQLDKNLAMQCAFFHDLGKAIDFEINKSHVEAGVQLAEKYHLHPTVILAIKSHHNDIIVDDIYCALVKIVDKLSASRKLAREDKNEYFSRALEIEKICKLSPYVQQAFVLKSCHEIKIIVKPNLDPNIPLELIAETIKQSIVDSDVYNENFKIKLILTKEITHQINL